MTDILNQIKNIISPKKVNTCRRHYLEFINNGTNILAPNTNPEHGIFSSLDWKQFILPGATRLALGLEDEGPFVDNAVKSHIAPFYLQFKDEVGTQLESFVGKLLGFKEPWCLPRSLLRCSVPGAESTPVHYDQIFLRAGPPTSVTAWVPIGDIEKKGGGLLYLAKSHDIGAKYEADFSKLNADLSDEEKVSHVNRNMNAGGWLDRNSSKFGRNWGRSWLVVRPLPPLLSV
jgi:phytanoyl-CoA hydroxylase